MGHILGEHNYQKTILKLQLVLKMVLFSVFFGAMAGMTQAIDNQISSANTGLLCKQLLNSHFALDFLWLLQYTALRM